MSFEMMEAKQTSGRNGMPASVSIRGYRGGRPGTYVALSQELTNRVKIKAADKFAVMIGTGEHRGLLRIKRDAKNGIIEPKLRKGAAMFGLGYVDQFGDVARAKEFTKAEMIDADTIEVVLPRWADDEKPSKPQPISAETSSQLAGKPMTERERQIHESNERRKRLGVG